MDLILLAVSAIFVNNILLAQYLGNCPFCGVSKSMDTSIGMGTAVIFVTALSSLFTWLATRFILEPFHLQFIQTLVFILIIASVVQLVEIYLKKQSRTLYNALGIYLPLITTNCAVMGVALLNVRNGFNFAEMLVYSVSSAAGFTLALLIFAGIRERLQIAPVPGFMKGTAIALVTAGIISLSFLGFSGMV